jgi:hypothetical protein
VDPLLTTTQSLNKAQRNLVTKRLNATQLRIAFLHGLRERIATRKTSSKLSPEESLKCIDRQLKQTAFFANIKYAITPTTHKPLSKVHVTTKTSTIHPDTGLLVEASHVEVVDTRIELEQNIIARNKKHFAQAEGTPFTKAPLNLMTATDVHDYFNDNGELQEALYDPPPNIDATVSFEDFVTSFLKWNDNTSTSPFGKTLGTLQKFGDSPL